MGNRQPARTGGADTPSARELRALAADYAARLEQAVEARRLLDEGLRSAEGDGRARRAALGATLSALPELTADLGPYVVVQSEGPIFAVPAVDARKFRKGGTKERRSLRRILGLLGEHGLDPRGKTLVDCGANIGTEALAALEEGFASVVAIEPHPESARLLRANIALNGAEADVTALELALSDRAGTGRLDVGAETLRKARMVAAGDPGPDDTVAVRLARLDDLAAKGVFDPERAGLVWLDVEGHEVHALRGAFRLLERAVPLVLELNVKLLRAAGTLDALPGLLQATYTHVADLRERAVLEPVTGLPALIASYEPNRGTDLLFCRPARA